MPISDNKSKKSTQAHLKSIVEETMELNDKIQVLEQCETANSKS